MRPATGPEPGEALSDGRDAVSVAELRAEVDAWAERIGVKPEAVHVRPMKRKWASCSSHGRLTFDVALLHEPEAFRREVIVHELLHLKVPNHAGLFRALLKAFLSEEREPGLENGPEERVRAHR